MAELSGQFVGGRGGSDKSSVVSLQVDVSVTELSGQFVGGVEGVAELSGQFVGGRGGSDKSSVVSL